MKNKLRIIFLSIQALILTTGLWAQSFSPSGIQFGPYFVYNQGMGSVTEHIAGNLSGGVNIFYQLPFNLPEYIPFSNIGISASTDFGTATGKKNYIQHWNSVTASAGVWFDWNLFTVFKLRPEVRYGTIVNIVESKERGVKGPQADQIIQTGASLIWEPDFMRGFSLYGGVDYKISPEKQNIGNFLGFNAGILYRPENAYKKKKAAEKIAAVQAAKALEAQKKLEEEQRVKDELEKARKEAERLEMEAKKKADEEVLARLKAEKEALEAQLKEAEERANAAAEEARLAAEKAEKEKAEFERIAAEEKAKAEAEAKAKTVKKVEIQMNPDGTVAIAIPNLSFVSDKAQLTQAKSNEETLNQVYEILTNPIYAKFKCAVTGYVNPDSSIWTESEKDLALKRSETVIQKLIEKGLDEKRFVSGYGSGKTSNKEYNRRVEFKLYE